jgi:hypothetical protein
MLVRWVGRVGAAALLLGLTLSAGASAQQSAAQSRGEYQVAQRGDRDGRDGRRDWNRGDRGGRDWNRGDRGGRDWDRNRWDRGPRWDRWDHRRHAYWRGRPWYWNRPAYVWGPPRYVFPPRYYYRGRVDPWDVIVWGVLPTAIYLSLADQQREYHQYAYNQAMAAPVGETIVWEDGGASGTIQTTRDGRAGDQYCREFQQTITIGGEKQEGHGVACQEPDGSWRLAPGDAG